MSFLPEYIDWHYYQVLPTLLRFWINITLFPFFYCAIPLHLKSLLLPWKRQKVKMKLGFHLDDFVYVLIFNIFSRVIGLFMRTTVILFGLSLMPVLFIAFAALPLVWVFLPVATIPIYLGKEPRTENLGGYLITACSGSLKKLLVMVLKSTEGKFIVRHLNLDQNNLLLYLANQTDEGKFEEFTQKLPLDSQKLPLSQILIPLSLSYLPLKSILESNKISGQDLSETAQWYEMLEKNRLSPLFLDLPRIKSLPGIGFDWAYGYTVEFDKYSHDLTVNVSSFPYLWGREKEISEMERILLKTQANNVILMGEPGVGRHILVETLANRIVSGQAPAGLAHKRILNLNMHALISSKPSVPEAKGVANEILEEAEYAGNIMVVVDEIDKYLAAGEGRLDFSDIFVKFANSHVGLIGITSPDMYHAYIMPNSSIFPLFETVILDQPAKETVIMELKLSIVPVLEKKHSITICIQAVKKAFDDADKYITSTPFPAKAIELIDEACVYLKTRQKGNILTSPLIDEFLSDKMQIPLGELLKTEKEKLLNLENILHQRIINQEPAIHAIASALRRSRLTISAATKPIGSFLFLGPTGVGKTETAKALAQCFFSSERRMLRFDMSQYQKEEGIERLIGSVKLGTPGELTSKLRDNPFSLILLDEFEKADKQVYNLFLTLLDEGYIENASGKKTDARNSIIIATSNAGAEFIREKIKQGDTADLQKKLIEHVQEEKIFSPELLNRFDGVIVFTPLSEGHLKEVAKIMLLNLNNRLVSKEISVNIAPELINKLVHLGFDPQFGARSMRRFIEEEVEDQVAQRLLTGNIKKGEMMEIEI